MATITLAGNTVNGCLGIGSYSNIGNAFSSAKKNTGSLNQSLRSLKGKVDAAASAADVSTAACKTKNSISREEQKQSSLTLANDKLDTLITDAGTIDNKAATEVERQKKEFYKKYSYLKPESEKSWGEKIKDKFKSFWDGLCEIGNAIKNFVCDAIEWIRENWKILAVCALVLLSIVGIIFGGPLILLASIGCLVGMLGSLLTNGIGNILSGKNFFEGALDAMIMGGITGAIETACVMFAHPYIGSVICSVLNSGYNTLILGEDFNLGSFAIDLCVGLVLTRLFFGGKKIDSLKDKAINGTTKWLSKNFSALKRLSGTGSYNGSYKMVLKKIAKGQVKNITWKTIRNGVVPKVAKKILGGIWDLGEGKVKDLIKSGIKQVFHFDFDFNIGGFDLFKALKIS